MLVRRLRIDWQSLRNLHLLRVCVAFRHITLTRSRRYEAHFEVVQHFRVLAFIIPEPVVGVLPFLSIGTHYCVWALQDLWSLQHLQPAGLGPLC